MTRVKSQEYKGESASVREYLYKRTVLINRNTQILSSRGRDLLGWVDVGFTQYK